MWPMADVVSEGGRLDSVEIEPFAAVLVFVNESLSQPPSDLRDLDRVGQATVERLASFGRHDLGDPGQPLEGGAVHDAIPISLGARAKT
jgi:hypothetical protein